MRIQVIVGFCHPIAKNTAPKMSASSSTATGHKRPLDPQASENDDGGQRKRATGSSGDAVDYVRA